MILEGEIKDGKMHEQFFIWFSNTHETLVRFDSNTGKSVENKMHNDVFLTNSEIFDIVVKYCLECLVLLLEKKMILEKEN